MLRRLRELDRIDAAPHHAGAGRPGRLRERIRTVAVTLGTVGLVSGWVVLSHGEPLGDPPEVRAGHGSHRYLAHLPGRPDQPVAYDPCRPIEIVVNSSQAPPGGDALFLAAVERVAAATGLVLDVTGHTQERVTSARDGGWLSGRRVPVLVDWTSPERVPALAGDVAGVAGSTAVDVDTGRAHYVTGTVALDAADLTDVLARRDGAAQVRAIIMHELGHLVGLDHVDDPAELMNEENLGLRHFGPGDRQGLARLGGGRCLPGL
jgi:hypothetical protein